MEGKNPKIKNSTKNPKIKNSTYSCHDYEYVDLKNVDIFSKVVSLQCSWIKRLFDNNFHQWKLNYFQFILFTSI